MQQIFSRLLQLQHTASQSNSRLGCTTQRPAQSPKRALLNGRKAPLPLHSLFLSLSLKRTQMDRTPQQQHSHTQSSRHFTFKHIPEQVWHGNSAQSPHSGERAALPPRLGLPFKCFSPHFLWTRSRHACARASLPSLPQSDMPSGGVDGGKEPPLILTGDRLVRQ